MRSSEGFAGLLMLLVTALIMGLLIFYYLPSSPTNSVDDAAAGIETVKDVQELKNAIERQDAERLVE